MRAACLSLLLFVSFGLIGCGGSDPVLMPDLVGKKLDAAYAQMEMAGLEDKDDVEVDGGGLFGIVVESNWTVCKQSPAGGKAMGESPTLVVKRSCTRKKPEKTTKPTPERSEPVETEAPAPSETASPKRPTVLTTSNSPELKRVLASPDECGDLVGRFADTYADETIRFDGHVADVAPAGAMGSNYLIGPGNFSPDSARGPTFQFKNESELDLRAGKNYTFTGYVGEFNEFSCLFQLTPVDAKSR